MNIKEQQEAARRTYWLVRRLIDYYLQNNHKWLKDEFDERKSFHTLGLLHGLSSGALYVYLGGFDAK